ncbi:putative dehydrogenase [Streptomyces ambofaciens]
MSDDMWAGRYDPPVEYMAHAKNGATLLSIMLGHGLEPLARVLGTFESLSAVVANQRGAGVRLSDGTTLPKDAPDEIVVAGVLEGGIVTSLHYSAGQSAGSALVWEIQGTDLTITLSRGSEPVQSATGPPAYAAPDLQLDAPAAGAPASTPSSPPTFAQAIGSTCPVRPNELPSLNPGEALPQDPRWCADHRRGRRGDS